MQKRVATIQDISCFGRCSLTVALPIISAAGITACGIPSAVLSTHTGGFTGYTFHDLTADIEPIAGHWKDLGLDFDAIYTGYLGSPEQINIVGRFIDTFRRPGTLVIVDPAMADMGKLYPGFRPDFPSLMAELCGKADVVVPNITEAAMMLGKEYMGEGYDSRYIESLCHGLIKLGAKNAVLTGVSFRENELGAACCGDDRKVEYVSTERMPGMYHGTGDVYASALTAALVKGFSLKDSALIAAKFTVESIRCTIEDGSDIRFGVDFERALPGFMKDLDIIR